MRARQPRRSPRRLLLGALTLLCIFYYLFFSGAGTAAYDPAAHARPSSSSAHENKTLYSIIIPTYHERANIRPLPSPTPELVIVDDDSRDGINNVVAELREEGFNVMLVVRTKEKQGRGGKGLSGAVLRGFEEARGESLVVMDADLQVRVISWGARSLARPLTSASDSMTGFFGIRKELFLHSAPLTPTGFKIGLELLLKALIPRGGVKEVPFSFGVREVGESKLSGKIPRKHFRRELVVGISLSPSAPHNTDEARRRASTHPLQPVFL
ncbi:hypothetical protein C8R44DRAFT_738237 [Mycena epipterygia]|nr:hypothetical protein C8R44DRAFT_738237 [Mycena epipterygia]